MTEIKSDTCTHILPDNITFSVQGLKIFRDQCMKCYDNPVRNSQLLIIEKSKWNRCMFEMLFWKL